jgi:VanZ family protein
MDSGFRGNDIRKGFLVKKFVRCFLISKLKYHFEWVIVGWAMVGVIIFYSLTPSPPIPGFSYADKLFHVAGYAGIMFWFAQLYEATRIRNLYAIAFMLMGIALEFAQDWGGVRVFEFGDMLANVLGVVLVWLIWQFRPIPLLRWIEEVLYGKT